MSNLPTIVPPKPAIVLDLDVTGKLCEEDDAFLTKWLAQQDAVRQEWAKQARHDFQWKASNLEEWAKHGYYPDVVWDNAKGVSGAEWLNGVLTSGSWLHEDHVRGLMFMVNAKSGDIQSIVGNESDYVSGKELWQELAPTPIRNLLNCLDDAACRYLPVRLGDATM